MSLSISLATTFLFAEAISNSLPELIAVTEIESLLKVSVALFANNRSKFFFLSFSLPWSTIEFVSAANPTTNGLDSNLATAEIISSFLISSRV